jgi:putative membrane protein
VWIYVKLAGVVVLTIVHVMLARHARAFAAGRNVRSERYFRLLNEVPTVAMIVIVIMVVVKPF